VTETHANEPRLSNSDTLELTEFRRRLHQIPEIAGEEVKTAQAIHDALIPLSPSEIVTGLGGHGIAAIYDSGVPGPTVLFRAELDALPIEEIATHDWVSTVPGKSHMCGHDGHMMFLVGLAKQLNRQAIAKGRVVLMFQPAEEDGTGARAVAADPRYSQLDPDYAFAIHIEPGRRFGHVSTRAGLINCASHGLEIRLTGKTAHAATPEDGVAPTAAVAKLLTDLPGIGPGGALDKHFRLLTITHALIGEHSFGIAPGDAVITLTLRAADDNALADMDEQVRSQAAELAKASGLSVSFSVCDAFAATVNDAEATDIAKAAMEAVGVPHNEDDLPMRASEDFGVFGWNAKAAMLCLGPGEDYTALHNPDYDFPDELIPTGVAIFERIARDLLGSDKR